MPEQGLFLPSFALSCNIVAALFRRALRREADGSYETLDAEAKIVLDQYKDKGNGYGWHAQNTITQWGSSRIIHYPHDRDYPSEHDQNSNSTRTPIILPFNRRGLQDKLLREALSRPVARAYTQNLTGLAEPSILVEVGEYFERPARLLVSSYNETRAGWLGGGDVSFGLGAGGGLGSAGAARGVRLVDNFTT